MIFLYVPKKFQENEQKNFFGWIQYLSSPGRQALHASQEYQLVEIVCYPRERYKKKKVTGWSTKLSLQLGSKFLNFSAYWSFKRGVLLYWGRGHNFNSKNFLFTELF